MPRATPPALLLARLRDGVVDEEVLALVRDGFARWRTAAGKVPLHVALGIPASPAALARQERDLWLREAAACLRGDKPWQQALKLRAAIVRIGATWDHLQEPPSTATRLEVCLHRARQAGAPMTLTARQLFTIIEANPENTSEELAPPRAA